MVPQATLLGHIHHGVLTAVLTPTQRRSQTRLCQDDLLPFCHLSSETLEGKGLGP